MAYGAKNRSVDIGGKSMDYVSFGVGKKNLVMIPGVGDGLRTVKGLASNLSRSFRIFAKDYKVYIFSRKNGLEKGCTTRDMARDLIKAMELLGIGKADVFGISQGGMIAQYMAIDYPEAVNKLILAVTAARPTPTLLENTARWLEMAEKSDYKGIMIDSTEKSYSEKMLKKYRPLYPILCSVGKPKSFERFIIQVRSVVNHNSFDELKRIDCPTLVLGGDSDITLGSEAAAEISGEIRDCETYIYEGLGHAAYDEARDFNARVLEFLNR